jgi:hypothetical protein
VTSPAPQLPDEDMLRRRRRRSIALALVLAGLVAIFYVLTIVKMGPAVFDRAM